MFRSARICVPVCEKDLDALRQTCERAVEWADVIELRLDCLEDIPEKLCKECRMPGNKVLFWQRMECGLSRIRKHFVTWSTAAD